MVGRRCSCDDHVDTFDGLKTVLAPRFPYSGKRERALLNKQLSLLDFMSVEAVLSLVDHLGGEPAEPDKADRLLANYALLRPSTFGPEEHLMQMARRRALSLASATSWRKYLESYLCDIFDEFRFFDVVEGSLVVRKKPFGGVDRRLIYLDWLLDTPASGGRANEAKPGKTYAYYPKFEQTDDRSKPERTDGETDRGSWRQVGIPDLDFLRGNGLRDFPHKGPRDEIVVSLDELIETAQQIGEATGKEHYASVLRRIADEGLLKQVTGRDTKSADKLRIHQVTNLVGLVGSGKSVLANVLMATLARRGLRIVTLLNSVSDVMECTALLRMSGVSASPLVSRGDRLKRLDLLSDNSASMLLDDLAARYLETPCLLDGLAVNEEKACIYESVPCRSLRGKKKGRYSCPFWGICPSTLMEREAVTSQIVVTTPDGFTKIAVDPGRKPFFELALEEFDLVIFDEADRVQVTLDNGASPNLSFQEIIRSAAQPTAEAMARPPEEKMIDLNAENYFDLRQRCDPVAKTLLKSVRTEEVATWKAVKDKAFTSFTLLNDLTEDEDSKDISEPGRFLPQGIVDDVQQYLDSYARCDEKLKHAIETSCWGINDSIFRYSLDDYLASRGCSDMDRVLKERFSFLLKVLEFDEYLRELAASSEQFSFGDESVSELYRFLRYSHVRQQRYLPSSLIGNLFGMKFDGNDLKLFRQFAFGRAFMVSLPWLDTDVAGRPTGPHALLLSGSSWVPGCLQYHVNRQVDYLLEVAPWKARKLAESRVVDLGIEQNVSGSGRERRSESLGIVLSGLVDTLRLELACERSGKALVIVNNYKEALDARKVLERQLGGTETVCALVREPTDDKERYVLRSELGAFASHPARVLVAPALAIERGFNIVDEQGHAAFSTLVFAVRPMGAPGDMDARYRMLNGIIETRVDAYPANPADFTERVRRDAWAQWMALERDETLPMGRWRLMGKDVLADDVIATLATIIIQLFGRLARLEDRDRAAPHVYFADAAFRGTTDVPASFRTLDELGRYLGGLMEKSDQPQVAKALYGPFYEAFRKGVQNGR